MVLPVPFCYCYKNEKYLRRGLAVVDFLMYLCDRNDYWNAMNIELFREICLSLPEATEDAPFDDTTVVFRLKGKIFACVSTDRPDVVTMKCAPDRAAELRAQYYAIEGAWHWNKKYWNQITLNGSVPDRLIEELVRHAYEEVNKKLPKKEQVAIEQTHS